MGRGAGVEANLQSLAVAHHGLDGVRLDGACEGLYPGLAPCSPARARIFLCYLLRLSAAVRPACYATQQRSSRVSRHPLPPGQCSLSCASQRRVLLETVRQPLKPCAPASESSPGHRKTLVMLRPLLLGRCLAPHALSEKFTITAPCPLQGLANFPGWAECRYESGAGEMDSQGLPVGKDMRVPVIIRASVFEGGGGGGRRGGGPDGLESGGQGE